MREDFEWVKGTVANIGASPRVSPPLFPSHRGRRSEARGSYSVGSRDEIQLSEDERLPGAAIPDTPEAIHPYMTPALVPSEDSRSPFHTISAGFRKAFRRSTPQPPIQNALSSTASQAAARSVMTEGLDTEPEVLVGQDPERLGRMSTGERSRTLNLGTGVIVDPPSYGAHAHDRLAAPELHPQAPIVDPYRQTVKKRNSFSTFGRDASRKIKALAAEKFPTWGRKNRVVPEEGVLAGAIDIHEDVAQEARRAGTSRSWGWGLRKNKSRRAGVISYF